jgi:Mg-chelatase subunit ChlD
MANRSGRGCSVIVVLIAVFFGLSAKRCSHSSDKPPTLTANASRTDGTAVYILIDVSGSMDDSVPNAQGVQEPKLAIAKRAAINACADIAKYAADDPKRNIRLAVASFSDDFVVESQMNKPDAAAAAKAINKLKARGATAIGNAVVNAQKTLDQTGLKDQHILVITDGENTNGAKPDKVADAINALPEALRPSVYIVAFDVNAGVFSQVKNKGWQIFSAADGKQLKEQLDEVVGGKILIEK